MKGNSTQKITQHSPYMSSNETEELLVLHCDTFVNLKTNQKP